MNQRRSIALRERPAPGRKRPSVRRPKLLAVVGGGTAVVLVIVLAIAILANRSADGGGPASRGTAVAAAHTVGGVEVQAASVDLGRVPLNKQITHNFVVKNTNAGTVQLGVPAIEVLDGC